MHPAGDYDDDRQQQQHSQHRPQLSHLHRRLHTTKYRANLDSYLNLSRVAKHETFSQHHKKHSGSPKIHLNHRSNHSGSLSRLVLLHNRCSRGYLWVAGTRIFANGSQTSPFVELQLESVGNVGTRTPVFTVQGVATKDFVCFNRRGKIVSKARGTHHLCRFQEGFVDPMYTVVYSHAHPTWYLSFDKRGRKIPVTVYEGQKDSSRCRHFTKTVLASKIDQLDTATHYTRKKDFQSGPTDKTLDFESGEDSSYHENQRHKNNPHHRQHNHHNHQQQPQRRKHNKHLDTSNNLTI